VRVGGRTQVIFNWKLQQNFSEANLVIKQKGWGRAIPHPCFNFVLIGLDHYGLKVLNSEAPFYRVPHFTCAKFVPSGVRFSWIILGYRGFTEKP